MATAHDGTMHDGSLSQQQNGKKHHPAVLLLSFLPSHPSRTLAYLRPR
jgi:hypothetical protein